MSEERVHKMVPMIKTGIDKAKVLIEEIEKSRQSKVVVLFCGDEPINHILCYRLLKLLRRLENVDKLDLFIDSGGGDIDAACKMVKILKQYSKKFSVLIPFMAKSAATLVALNAEEIVMSRAAELGVADPQVREPITGAYVPAHSIKEAIDFIEEVNDPYVKLSLADKLPPLLIGAFRDAQNASEQYISEALEKLQNNKDEAVHTFTKKYLSHGYPIDRDECKEKGLNVICPNGDLENKMGDLFEIYGDLMVSALSDFEESSFSVIQTNRNFCALVNGRDITCEIDQFQKYLEKATESTNQKP